MDKLGMYPMAPIEPLVAAHLHPPLLISSRTTTLSSKVDLFQPALTESAYRAAVVAVEVLNVSSMI